MDPRTLEILEFNKIKERLTALASTPMGKQLAWELQPQAVLESARYDLRETSEMRALWEINREPPLDGVCDLTESIHRCRISGAMLEPIELLEIASTLEAVERVQKSLHDCRDKAAGIAHFGSRLIVHPEIVERIHATIDEFAQVRDGASPQLNRLRREIRELRAAIVRRLEKLMRGTFKEFLAENLYTLREDRYVLPIDARYKNKVSGILHDRSSTGTTVYVEPMHIVQDGNHLKDLRREDEMEVRRILREITQEISAIVDDLQQNQVIFAQLDFLGAKARLSIQFHMSEPRLERGAHFDLRQAKHPLLMSHLGADQVIPLSLLLEPPTRGIVISGPNTGGKTVVLKTIGLICLMAQSGLHVPAREGSVLPWFDDIGADIGDEQSLEQSLSTFSSHITHIRELLKRAKDGTLVLLDELGSGTDPMEGGALATAILQELAESCASFVVTTHLDAPKVFAHTNEYTTNASLAFDRETLQPTYHFSLGLPGRSNAIQIAQRLGLPPIVIERAKAIHDESATTPEELLHRLSAEIQAVESMRDLAAAEHAKSVHVHEEAQRQLQKAKNQARDIIERGQRKAQGLLQELERRLEHLAEEEKQFRQTWRKQLDELVEQAKNKPEPESALDSIRSGIEAVRQELEDKPQENQTLPSKVPGTEISAERLLPGVTVNIMGLSETGIVRSYNTRRDEIEVLVKGMTLRVARKRIDRIIEKKKESESVKITYDSGFNVPMSIDIHGMTVEDSLPLVERFIDQAYRAGHPYVTICHGGGMGILRKMVRGLLPNISYVKNFRNGLDYEGGNGVTIANFKERID